ncbi:class I SAM-dependent methyltransferase [Vibrio scophthalmi]|uniref:class I SAM-dependent methyltransferase n=1 Tax=Vibrio scophthalmi TaxID=45658 RepID=UPI00228510FB|nr:class I SAM-dependent methyltransferase [Vibrio scophthalmi]MCY9803805.1 class I SAM-dependent methyltransferase [Vibrio scophthalmi]
MSEEYNGEVSTHYAAYRPPIHRQILAKVLPSDIVFLTGLDIGCGTGVSTQALSDYCQQVVGIDPSEAMLAQAVPCASISYKLGDGESIPQHNDSIDIVTFAGSLYYAKSDLLVQELLRVCRQNALVIAYDFEVQLSGFMQQIGVNTSVDFSQYNHAENFTGFSELHEVKVHQGQLCLSVSSEQLAHVLFSSLRRYKALTEMFGVENTFTVVVNLLNQISAEHKIMVDIYYSTYQISRV